MRRWLGSPRIALAAASIAAALTLPSLGNGLGIDDHLYRARVLEGWDAARSAAALFSFANPDRPDEDATAMRRGELSWWATPGLRLNSFRPLSQLVHHLEFRLAGRGALPLMHLQSVLWMAALAAAAAALFRRFFTVPWVAGLAAILYAVDDGHGLVVGWLASRCTIMATFFAILSLAAHHEWRTRGWRPGALLAPLALVIGLLFSEQAIGVLGYLVAHLLLLEGSPWRARARASLPHAGVVAAWYVVRSALGHDYFGTGLYTDALREPLLFLRQALVRIPICIHSQLGALPADLWEVFFVRRGLTWVMVLAGCLFLVLTGAALRRLVGGDRLVRFWMLGGLLALVPVCAAHPNDRHLLLVGLGGSALVARYLAAWAERRSAEGKALLPRRGATALAAFFVVVHGVLAPIALPLRARIPGSISRGLDAVDALAPHDARLGDQHLVLVNTPFKYLCNLASVVRRSNGGVSPQSWLCLGVSPGAVRVRREDDHTLVLRPEGGYLRQFEDANVRSRSFPFAPGDQVSVAGLAITVREVTADGRPQEVAFRFDRRLEDPSLRLLVWQRGGYRPFAPPLPGQVATLGPERFDWADLLLPAAERRK